jgi:hypothetical protein
MIDERFSAESFEKTAYNSAWLCRLLRDEIVEELDRVLEPMMLDIIQQLNALGHKLAIYDLLPGSTTFIERLDDEKQHDHDYKIVVGTDITVTVDRRS